MKFYSKKRIIISITLSVIVFFIVGAYTYDREPKANDLMAGIFGTFITLAILLPKIWWNFLLDLVRKLSRAIKDED